MAELNNLSTLLGPTEFINSGITTNLKAYYRFESGALTTDSSGESHTLTAISDPAEGTGKFGGGVDLDGNDAYSAVDHADFKPTGAFTVGFWIKSSTTGATQQIIQSYSQNSNFAGWYIRVPTSNVIRFVSGKNNGTTADINYKSLEGTRVVCDGTWHFVTCTSDGSTMKTYIDGSLDVSVSWANNPAYAATNYVRIACANTTGSDGSFFTGSLDDVFLINGTALTADQISTLYGALAYWRLEGNSNDTKGLYNGTDNTITYAAAKFGQGISQTANGYISMGNVLNFGTSNYSVSLWIKTNYSSGNITASSKNGPSKGWSVGMLSTGEIFFYSTDGTNSQIFNSTTTYNDDLWHHVVITRESATSRKIYVDGVLKNTGTTNIPNTITDTGNFQISGYAGTNERWYGMIDDVAPFSRALTLTEILQLYLSGTKSLFFSQI